MPSKIKQIVVICTVLIICQSVTHAQQYPTTPYQGYGSFDQASWSVTSPGVPDIQVTPGFDDSESMSPDSWSSTNTFVPQIQNNGFQNNLFPASSNQGITVSNNFVPRPAPNDVASFNAQQEQPNSASDVQSAFQPAGFLRNKKNVSSTDVVTGNSPLQQNEFDRQIVNGRYPLGASGNAGGSQFAAEQNSAIPMHGPAITTQPTNSPDGLPNFFVQQNTPYPIAQNSVSPFPVVQYPAGNFPSHGNMGTLPVYRPDLGHRSGLPTVRNFGSQDRGQKYDFEEKKKEYPPMSEILATGRYFASAGVLVVEPHFQANTAIAVTDGANSDSQLFGFDLEAGPSLRLGFESKYGPGIELSYWQVDGTSDTQSFTSNGVSAGETSTWMLGPSRWSRLTAANADDTISAVHEVDVEKFGVSFFKEVQLPISRINGSFGFQYVKIFQSLDATLVNGGATIGTLEAVSDMEAYGPHLVFEYYRPVGHTKLEFITSFGASVLFGDRNQFVENTITGETSRIQANEFITAFDFFSGAQFKKNFAEKRSYFARAGITYSSWIGGGTANDPNGSFGLRGFSFSVGYNR